MSAYGRMESAILGLPYGLDFQVDSVVASAAITPGRPVYQTPGSPNTAKSTYASGDVFLGIAVVAQQSHIADVGTYAINDTVNVLTKGKIWVQVSATVSGAPAAAYADSNGLFAPTASGNYNVGAMFRTNQTTVSGLIVVEVTGAKVVA